MPTFNIDKMNELMNKIKKAEGYNHHVQNGGRLTNGKIAGSLHQNPDTSIYRDKDGVLHCPTRYATGYRGGSGVVLSKVGGGGLTNGAGQVAAKHIN